VSSWSLVALSTMFWRFIFLWKSGGNNKFKASLFRSGLTMERWCDCSLSPNSWRSQGHTNQNYLLYGIAVPHLAQALFGHHISGPVVSSRPWASPGNLPMLRIVAAQTFNLILLDAAARKKHGVYSGTTVDRLTSLDWSATLFLCFANEWPHRKVSD
jgi:hypothetical protein